MIVTRSATSATTPMLWVTSSTPRSRSSARSRIKAQDLRLDGHVERRRRLVGDEQLRVAGERCGDDDALALAAGELVRIGARAAAPAPGCRPPSGARAPAPAPAARPRRRWKRMVSQSWLSIVKSGLRLVIGSWKIAPMSRPGTIPFVRPVACRGAGRRCAIEPAAMRPGASRSPIAALPIVVLPAPDSPTRAWISPGAIGEADVVDRPEDAVRRRAGTRRVRPRMSRCGGGHRRALSFGLKRSRSQSPTTFTASTSSDEGQRRERSAIHQMPEKTNSLPMRISVPSEG